MTASQAKTNVMTNGRLKIGRVVRNIALIVASGWLPATSVFAAQPPPDLLRKVAEREQANSRARDNYTYRQVLLMQELDTHGVVQGELNETRDVTFSPERGRSEQVVAPVKNTLLRVKLTPEDYSDIRNIESLLLTPEKISLYEGQYKGEETKDGERCFVEFIRPRQILSGQRFFEGLIWVRQSDLSVVRSEGQAVPQIETAKTQNLFPHFTTVRRAVDNQWMFPAETVADDTLFFRNWPQRVRITIRYSNYKRFGSESTVIYSGETPPPGNNQPPANPPSANPPTAPPPH